MDLGITTTAVTGTITNIFASEVGITKPSFTATILASNLVAADVGGSFPGYLPVGFPLGKVTADGSYRKLDVTESDGSEVFAGVLGEDVPVTSATSIVHGSVLTHCVLIEANLPVAIVAGSKAEVPTIAFR
jgi:hypothetical protein